MLRFLRNFFRGASASEAGGDGERLAADWLRRERGLVIVARNWRSPRDRRDEIDLVCRDGDALVFVEVKARSAQALVPGYYAVDARKKRAVRRAAEVYLAGLAQRPTTFRFDVVEVSTAGKAGTREKSADAPQILHFENVSLFGKHFRG